MTIHFEQLIGRTTHAALVKTLLLMLAITYLSSCTSLRKSENTLPENNLVILLGQLGPSQPSIQQQNWIKEMVETSHPHFTERCQAFFDDLQAAYWGDPESGEAGDFSVVQARWAEVYDLGFVEFGQAFETGNCGWTVKKAESIEYLGYGNKGYWYNLTVKGGCHEGDSDHRVKRVLKLVSSDDRWLIDAIYAPEGD